MPGHERCAQASHQASSSPTLAALNNSGGIVRALDRGEWFIDTAAQQIYVRTPSGQRPAAGSVEAKRRTYGFNLDGDGYLTLRGIRLFATSLTTDNLAANRNGSPGGVATPAHCAGTPGRGTLIMGSVCALVLAGARSVSRCRVRQQRGITDLPGGSVP